ncbi:hypothetical protein [Endozoicomonas euniceicola]|uniref:Phosphoribosyltransferase domain-containing protein n=1 Tax=Endozoicomonas euniceicola TaxID=1234143 RepID=A0ABY6GVY5_9GAMM|nr:hypothetical protein [Endozoicomonas euniceicola]UYM16569.1 hypothetical protein NX720_01120 [Endozoicomonas euniceicola]
MKNIAFILLILLLPFITAQSQLSCFAMDPPFKEGASAAEECPDDCTLAELEQFAKKIANLFPPDEYLYIGIGRSPAPVIAWLQAKGQRADTIQIPLSNFKLCQRVYGNGISFPEFPSDYSRVKLFRHFDRYLRTNPGFQKKWLVIDVAESGNTLRSAGFALKEYAHERGLDNSIEMLAICENNQKREYYLEMGMHVAMAQYKPNAEYCVTALEYFLIFGSGKRFAPYGELNWADLLSAPHTPPVEPPRTSYNTLSKLIKEWAKSIVLSVFWTIALTSTSKFNPSAR